MDDKKGALADFNAALIANPQLGDGYINRAALLISLGRYRKHGAMSSGHCSWAPSIFRSPITTGES